LHRHVGQIVGGSTLVSPRGAYIDQLVALTQLPDGQLRIVRLQGQRKPVALPETRLVLNKPEAHRRAQPSAWQSG